MKGSKAYGLTAWLLAWLWVAPRLAAQVGEAPFTDDPLAFFCIPDVARTIAAHRASPLGQWWLDASMQPFREKLATNWQTRVLAPVEGQLGVKTADLTSVLDGRLAFAILPQGWPEQTNTRPTWLLLAQTRQHAERARLLLKDLAVRQLTRGQGVRTISLREAEFYGFPLNLASLDPRRLLARLLTSPPGTEDTNQPPTESRAAVSTNQIVVWVGQHRSNVVAGIDTNLLDRLLGSLATNTAEGHFALPRTNAAAPLPPDTTVHGSIDLRPFVTWARQLADATDRVEATNQSSVPMPKRSALLKASGLTGLRSASFALRENADGSFGDFALELPGAARVGLFKALELEAKDASPPRFVPAGATRFERVRLDFGKSWRALENMLTDVFPQAAGVLRFLLETAGQGAERVDLRQELLAALGDDLVRYQLLLRTNTSTTLHSPPTALLLPSTNAARLVASVNALALLLPPDLTELGEQTNNGWKVHTLRIRSKRGDASGPGSTWSFAAGPDAAVFATDPALLEEFLATNTAAQPLLDSPDLTAAANRIGGMSRGLFGYENLRETLRPTLEILRTQTNGVARLLESTPFAPAPGQLPPGWADWMDGRLLPPFEQVAHHFGIAAFNAEADDMGFQYRWHLARPPVAQ